MSAVESRFRLAECARCGDLVLAGRIAGLAWRVGTRTLTRAQAGVLAHFGVGVLALRRGPAGAYAETWHPADPAGAVHLLAPHVCGSAHARGQVAR